MPRAGSRLPTARHGRSGAAVSFVAATTAPTLTTETLSGGATPQAANGSPKTLAAEAAAADPPKSITTKATFDTVGRQLTTTDGLIEGGEEGYALTWMDAKVGDWVVTPRHGKPVEINALWLNALLMLAEMEEKLRNDIHAAVSACNSSRTEASL